MCTVHGIDINQKLVSNANRIAKAMNLDMHSHAMDMGKIDFPDEYFAFLNP